MTLLSVFDVIFQSRESLPYDSKVVEYKYIWFKKWGNKQRSVQPYLLACQLPQSHWGKTPASVSIVEEKCDKASNNLRVTYNKPEEGEEKKKFAVCVKGLDFPEEDISVRLVEWIELVAALGAEKIYFYILHVHDNISRVLHHYRARGLVDIRLTSLPGYLPNTAGIQHQFLSENLEVKRKTEVIPLNDCFYRSIYNYKHLAVFDIDEVIIPINHNNWADMMEEIIQTSLKVKNETRASWHFRNVYFMDEMLETYSEDIPLSLHMMQHVWRSANYTRSGQYVKSVFNPSLVLLLHNHLPLACLAGVCVSHPVNTSQAQLQHYRKDCPKNLRKNCRRNFSSHRVLDTAVWRWRKEVSHRAMQTLTALGLVK